MKLYFQGDIEDIKKGIDILSEDFGFEIDPNGLKVQVEKIAGSNVCVEKTGDRATIRYSEKIHFFRALGLLLEALGKRQEFNIVEEPQFTMNGPMFDVSQGNAVMRVETIKEFIKRISVMGLNMLMLYSEDSYEVKEEPYFGYMRGKYTFEELKECDDYADIFGIEMIPCIQTLAHLVDVLRWPVYKDMRDDEEILLVGNEKVYEFIEHIITAAAAPFRTKRIHIGMDEAWHLGLGAYLENNGYKRKFDIMNEHLARVMEIVKKHNLQPMLWSDMYFRAASKTGDYYDTTSGIPQEVMDSVPKGAQLVYWDYYHDNEEFYVDFIKRHREFGTEPVFAGGIWTWFGFNANWGKTFSTTNPALNVCKREGIKEIIITIWGDNGTESNVYSNLLGLQLFAEHGYAKELDMDKLKNRFGFCTGCNYDDFMSIKYLDEVPGTDAGNLETFNPSKYLMWQDLLTGLFDKNIEGLPLDAHYEKLAANFKASVARNGRFGFVFEFLAKVSDVLALKSEMGIRITQTYKNRDKAALKNLAEQELPELERRVKALRGCHKEHWFIINKALGWDILDMRYGSLLIRIQTAMEEIHDYLNGKLKSLEELEEKRLSFSGEPGLVKYSNFYDKIVSGSRIAPRG